MTLADVLVLTCAAAAIAAVLWYFLGSRGSGVRAVAENGVQRVRVVVKGAYDPDTIVVEAGRPVRLEFYRDETNPCSEDLVLDAFGIRRELPAFETTAVEFTPHEPGEYGFTCGMSMMRGRVVVEPSGSWRAKPAPNVSPRPRSPSLT